MTGIDVLDNITVFRLTYTLLSHLTEYTKIQRLRAIIGDIVRETSVSSVVR